VSENVVRRRILAVKIQKVAEGYRIIHSEEFRSLCSLFDIYADKMNEDEMGGFCSMHSVNEKCLQNWNHMAYFMLLWMKYQEEIVKDCHIYFRI
jgi:hypothetical protein